MLRIYGTSLSSPSNKVRFLVDILDIPHEFHEVSLRTGEHKKPEYLAISPYGKVPAIDDDGFTLAESNTILRYLADKHHSDLYPRDLKQRAKVDQWLDFASMHISLATSKIAYNMYFCKMVGTEVDQRALEDNRNLLNNYLPVLEKQLSHHAYIAGDKMTIADISLLAALDVCEVIEVDLSKYPQLSTWRNKLMQSSFYKKTHNSYAEVLQKVLAA